jgi:hypothetical protein
MDRLTRFIRNAGPQGCVFSGIVAVIVLFGMIRDFRVGHWTVTLPILLATIGLTYTVRSLLVHNMSIMRVVMDALAIAGIAAVVLLPKVAGPEPLWMRALMIAFLGTYMGCYFWMLSDDRIAVI